MAEPVLISRPRDHLIQLTLNRPDKLNAMTAELISALHDALDQVAKDRTAVPW